MVPHCRVARLDNDTEMGVQAMANWPEKEVVILVIYMVIVNLVVDVVVIDVDHSLEGQGSKLQIKEEVSEKLWVRVTNPFPHLAVVKGYLLHIKVLKVGLVRNEALFVENHYFSEIIVVIVNAGNLRMLSVIH